ncbi:MAG TPA: hypothetical protein VLX92_32275, partial [Kofleriaceae bacterium]|nr:hypothetical protein [Kofleriaceae bacterium]
EAVTATLLPRHLARAFGLPESRASAASVHGALAVFAPFYRALPPRWVAIPARSAAARRLAGKPPARLDAWMERQLFGLSRQVSGQR